MAKDGTNRGGARIGSGQKKKALIDPNKCDGCGLCPALCPKDAIVMEGEVPIYLGDFN